MKLTFHDYHSWETEVKKRGLLFAPIAQRSQGRPCSVDIEMAFKLEDESHVDFGAFNIARNFGVICDTPEEFGSWRKV